MDEVPEKRKRCKNGERYNKTLKKCIPYEKKTRRKTVSPSEHEPPSTTNASDNSVKENIVKQTPTPGIPETASIAEPMEDVSNKKKRVYTFAKKNEVPPKKVPSVQTPTPGISKDSSITEEQPNVVKPITNTRRIIQISPENIDKPVNKEIIEYQENATDNSYDFLYPNLNDPNFAAKIARKKEFGDYRYDGEVRDVKMYSDMLCNTPYELAPHQIFVKNFLSFQTPYNSLLLYHSLGSGKTQSAIGVTEEMRDYMKQTGLTQKIIIVASPNVQANFQKELFNESRLVEKDGLWTIGTPIGDKFIREINPTNIRGIPRQKIVSQIRSIINSYYVFMGYIEFSHYVERKTGGAKRTDAEQIQLIKKLFNNRLIVIDEVHNIRITEENKKKSTGINLFKLANYTDNLRLLLLSATPMYNSYTEIIWLTNLMNLNDGRPIIKQSDVFLKNSEFRTASSSRKESGAELLSRKLTGYVSFVRGENPYTFPFRLYPRDFSTTEHYFDIDDKKYPIRQMNGRPIENPLKYINVYLNKIGVFQERGYQKILNSIKTRFSDETFEEKESFGYNLLQAPLEALNIVYPGDALMNGGGSSAENSSDDDEISVTNKNNRKNAGDEGEEEDAQGDEDENAAPAVDIGIDRRFIGKKGLESVMEWIEERKDYSTDKYNFKYKFDTLNRYGNIFGEEHIYKYSHKIASICNIIRNGAKGIILIYSNYIDGGLVPMALALEEMGFSRFGSTMGTRSLFETPPKEEVDANTMNTRTEFEQIYTTGASIFRPAKYVMITGDKSYSKNNAEDIKYVIHPDNKYGENIKVVLISRSGSEGLDFKCIRQVHILDSWYNMSRIEQIIGRGVRNLSHCALPFEERNVEIYLHATMLETKPDEEAIDLYLYRFAEKKALRIGKVTRLLKEISVDCILNIGQSNLTVQNINALVENKNIKINTSSGRNIDFLVGDKPMTELCDYMDNCMYKCSSELDKSLISSDITTYTTANAYIEKIIYRIRELFREQPYYKRKNLIQNINIIKKYSLEQIYTALNVFIKEKEYLVDKRGRYGYMINRGEYYLFQPSEITDKNATIYERTAPVDYKRDRLIIENIPSTLPTVDESFDEHSVQSQQPLKHEETFLSYFKTQLDIYDSTNSENVENKEKDWYKHAKLVTPFMKTFHDIDENIIRELVIEHMIDMYPDKLNLLEWVRYANPKTQLEQILYNYIENKKVTSEQDDIVGYLIEDGNTWKIYVVSKIDEPLVMATKDDTDKLIITLKRTQRIYKKNDYNNIVGFINPFKDNSPRDMAFKMKHMDQPRNNKGNTCASSGQKGDLLKDINSILNGEKVYPNVPTNKTVKYGFCCIAEFLLRINQRNKKDGKVWFLTPELAAINRVKDV